MTTTPTQNDPLIELVKRLDPLTPESAAAAPAHKQEILGRLMGTMGPAPTPTTGPSPEHAGPDVDVSSLPEPLRRRGRSALLGLVAAAAAVLAITVLFGLFRAPSAEAVLSAAAERSALFESGRVEIVVLLRDPVETTAADFQLHYSFEGDDHRLDLVSQGVVGVSEVTVDGISYFGNAFANGELVWSANTDNPFAADYLEGLSAADARPDTVLALIDLAADYQLVSTDAGDRYTGTISRADLLAQPSLPAGVSIVTSGADPASELPETMVLEVLVVDELIDEVVLQVQGDLPTGEFVNATVTTTYSEYGEPQNIVAPFVVDGDEPIVQLPASAALPIWAPGPVPQTDAELVLAEVLQRRPRLCFSAGLPVNPEPGQQVTSEEIKAGVAECFTMKGEAAAAAAIASMSFDF